MIKLMIRFLIIKLLCYARHLWTKFQQDKILQFGAPLLQLAHAKVGPNNMFHGPSDPFAIVGDKMLKQRWYSHFFDPHHGCNNLRNTPSIAAIKASARSSRGDQNAKIR